MSFRNKVKKSFLNFKRDVNAIKVEVKKLNGKIGLTQRVIKKSNNNISDRLEELERALQREVDIIKRTHVNKSGFKKAMKKDKKTYDQRGDIRKINNSLDKLYNFTSSFEDKFPGLASKDEIKSLKEELVNLKSELVFRDDFNRINSKIDSIDDTLLMFSKDLKDTKDELKKTKKGKLPEVMENYIGVKEHQKKINQINKKLTKQQDKLEEFSGFIDETYSLKKEFVTKENLNLILKEMTMLLDAMKHQTDILEQVIKEEGIEKKGMIEKISKRVARLLKNNK